MNKLIEQVKAEIHYRGYSDRTGKSYCAHLLKLSHYFNKPLDSITDDELNAFFKDPVIRTLSRASQGNPPEK
ncbi:hypothetical protein PSECIP111951_01888 [Pseudoalteromonas holothuriae]|uniref:Integrase SAM-like N-terminal domain-containing protein n=1 Tax=Pseudoalteromonas holothuriae TaxID=2963714 RepID=A0A9W4R5U0_9GAMM|nr:MULTISPECIES: phage integrase N-terminal SAM-like domain-containing protein [unclassified Pseudoalteromonas]CAH9058497.1 hypothetical protein PSECIP111951_01888 [Pseudoalteromonas sp. CIP111951]CAH9067566.1 hypothetical protein PSECIP111854_04140 [Pseudoalteromonas sp. CIP111854]